MSITAEAGPLADYRHDGFWCEMYRSRTSPAPHAVYGACANLLYRAFLIDEEPCSESCPTMSIKAT